MKKPVIAIDGYSSTGKSSISKIVAEKLGIIHLDTGALYRGITYFALRNCFSNNQIHLECLFSKLPEIQLSFQKVEGDLVLLLNNQPLIKEIRTQEVSDNVSFVAKQKEVRDFLLETQQSIAKNGGVIMDGRDIGTVVLPDANFKFFLTASIEERTKRRYFELIGMSMHANKEEVKNNLIARDKIDSEREIAPLKKADDAIEIDNSNLTKDETVQKILSYIK